MHHFELNQKVKVSPKNDNDCYSSFRDKVLIIANVAKNTDDHPGYDNSMSPMYLYDLKTESGENINCSLYDYELVSAE